MKRDELIVRRLFKAAGQLRNEATAPISFPLEARILAAWRSSAAEEDLSWMASCFRCATICAVLIMVASIGWSQFARAHEVPGQMALSNLTQIIQIVP